MWPALIMAGMGAAQYASQRDKEARDRKLAAATQMYSPWTGMQAGPVREADLMGTVGQGAVQGMAMSQNMEKADQANRLNDAQIKYYNAASQTMQPQTQQPGNTAPSAFGPNNGMMSMEDPNVLKARQGGNQNLWALLAAQNKSPYGG